MEIRIYSRKKRVDQLLNQERKDREISSRRSTILLFFRVKGSRKVGNKRASLPLFLSASVNLRLIGGVFDETYTSNNWRILDLYG